jgi:uncharacterized protein YecE (DUF72 family)
MNLRIGCSGFPVARIRYWERFSVVEIQQTFYQPPRLQTARRWRQEAPPEFEFTLKAWQLITHEATSPTYRRLRQVLSPAERQAAGGFKPTALVQMAWEQTRAIAQELHAGLILFQCPASFGPTAENRQHLRRFFETLDRDKLRLVWEPRGTWTGAEVGQLCQELDLIPGIDPFKTPPFPGAWAYFRLHGITGYRYQYSDQDLEHLVSWLADRERVYCFFNNQSMWADALRFQAQAVRFGGL